MSTIGFEFFRFIQYLISSRLQPTPAPPPPPAPRTSDPPAPFQPPQPSPAVTVRCHWRATSTRTWPAMAVAACPTVRCCDSHCSQWIHFDNLTLSEQIPVCLPIWPLGQRHVHHHCSTKPIDMHLRRGRGKPHLLCGDITPSYDQRHPEDEPEHTDSGYPGMAK